MTPAQRQLSRRSLLAASGLPIGLGLGAACQGCDECPGRIDRPAPIADSPADFEVAGTTQSGDSITTPVLWRPSSEFDSLGFPSAAAVAFDDDVIWLNQEAAVWVDAGLVAHEFGHILGFGHIDGTVMDFTVSGMTDKHPDEPLADPTTEIVEHMDAARLIDWQADDAINALGEIASQYARGETSISQLGIAASRYARGVEHRSVWFETDWGRFGGFGDVPDSKTGGRFYSST